MMEAQVSTSRKAEVNRPENTKRSYAPKQKEYKDWCDEAFSSISLKNCYTVYGDKLHLFLKDCVVNRTHRRDTGKTIKYGTAMAYLAAIVDMYQKQVKVAVGQHEVHNERAHRAENQDRGLGTLVDGYTTENEIASIVSYYFLRSSGGHPLWQHGVFHDPKYIEFKRSVKAFVETDVEPTDILLQRALPLMARKLADMQNADSGFRREVLREFGVLHQKIDDLVSGRIPLWSLQEDGGERGEARSTEVQAFPVPANNSGPISQLSDIPVRYRMSRDVQTVPDLWREWHVGLSGCVSIHEMETRRKRIVNRIKKYMVDNSSLVGSLSESVTPLKTL
ncbi:hypothetical protein PHYBLDRAFT_61139 [Phycomyces blakesleeanus NRRL 1555(-)]|uniref:Transcription activator GCR1-like domain-containing protein n=1 Tax=Phycomyces blakesleeanus (strain ATCC 8743b / DSM 1359 / FGSC 10004 / NBRC 33097 / NRRL 1555) TaxID=763407 RepID=A0A162UAK8_PHYB8|nr:hypothetical protein PHYBLDRAFT_61139 [Phycomyces blakesleeanus NRRL 1555(-)]OAD74812.1 hypothetical protein PHYBLDRAFT_61139 [Phycomyces blakesleeanus NRRL 1555(-)]|eukprot:XP_018292852.1 hypothetical protein PHYBLDRAFT_61139 [Phycomyces blakesleeanus NRRL 1555(-)]